MFFLNKACVVYWINYFTVASRVFHIANLNELNSVCRVGKNAQIAR